MGLRHLGPIGLALAWAVAVLGIGGCALKGGPVPAGGADAPGEYWRIGPVDMRVYPSSGLVRQRQADAVEARIELLDEMGDATKGVGQLRFELYAGRRMGESTVGLLLASWDVSMLSLAENREHYDAITRTYRFVLGLESPPPRDEALQLAVTFVTPQGRRLEARAMIGGGTRAED